MRIALVSGRTFLDPNDPSGARDIVVSRAIADRYWPDPTGRAALGHRIRFSEQVPWSTIVGVVESVRDTSLEAAPVGEMYFPLTVAAPQTPDSLAPFTARVMSAVVRVNGDPSALAPVVRATLRELDPSIPMYDVLPMTDILARASARTRFVLVALAAAAVITLLLGAVGLYGVIAYAVSLRTRELGLRLALGAQPSSVLALVLGEGLSLAVIGAVAGLATFMLLGRLLRGLLFQVAPTDPLTLAAVTAALFLAAGMATWIPARRAARIDPVEALRV
jgi:ABC-type antimicrobial peptide transport system permease subunit